MRTFTFKVFSFLILAFPTTLVMADMFQPSHSCSKPFKPYQFNNQYEVDQFKFDVESYKQCISDFVEEQNEAMRQHSNAADEAIEDWNNFVRWELN